MAYINNSTFIEIFPDETSFKNNYQQSTFYAFAPMTSEGEEDEVDYLSILYNLLYARFNTSQVACKTEEIAKMKFNAVIFQYGPTWVKELSIQKKIRELTESEMRSGATTKNTHGYNPSDVPGTANSDTEIETVNDQSLQKYTKSKLDGYATLLSLVMDDVTEKFLSKFKKLFKFVIDTDEEEI